MKFAKFLERRGCPCIFADAPQRGLYVLMKDAVQVIGSSVRPVFQPDEIKPVFDKIQNHAASEYGDDKLLHVLFGPPDKICRKLAKSEYERFLVPEILDSVDSYYETAEKTFNVQGICRFLRAYIAKFNNITILTGANVTRLRCLQNESKGNDTAYRISWHRRGGFRRRTKIVWWLTLACWERVGVSRKQLGKAEHQPTHNRLKMLAVIDIDVRPDRRELIRPIFVASGPFCMISPQSCITKPDGRVVYRCLCTLAIKTNVMVVPDDKKLPASYDTMIRGKTSVKEKLAMASEILDGARQFFACPDAATLVDVRFGTVRVPFGSGKRIDLHDVQSEHHARDYPGCQQAGDQLYINEAMKLIYSVYNAERFWNGFVRLFFRSASEGFHQELDSTRHSYKPKRPLEPT